MCEDNPRNLSQHWMDISSSWQCHVHQSARQKQHAQIPLSCVQFLASATMPFFSRQGTIVVAFDNDNDCKRSCSPRPSALQSGKGCSCNAILFCLSSDRHVHAQNNHRKQNTFNWINCGNDCWIGPCLQSCERLWKDNVGHPLHDSTPILCCSRGTVTSNRTVPQSQTNLKEKPHL